MALPSAPFDAAQSIYAGLTVVQLKLAPALSGVTAATDTITKTAHGLTVGQQVVYVSGTGYSGLVAGTAYFVIAAPTADTFKVSATSTGTAISVGTSTEGVFQPVQIFEAKQLTSKLEQEEKSIERPDADGVLRKARTIQTKQQESFMYGLDEVKRLLKIFNGSLAGRATGTATLWIPDPDDATGKCALKSENDFACTITRDGDMEFGGGEFSKATIKLESNKVGPITWTADASIA